MRRIILDRDDKFRARPQVPPYQEITHEAIAAKGAGYDAAKTALAESKRSLVEAQQELPQSQWKDAEAAETARAEGKPELKTRTHTQQHEKRIADLEHEQRVSSSQSSARLMPTSRARSAPVRVGRADRARDCRTGRGVERCSRRADLALRAAQTDNRDPRAGDRRRPPRRADRSLSLAQAQSRSIAVGDLLAALTDVGMPEPELE